MRVIGPVEAVGGAGRARDRRGRGADDDVDLLLLGGDSLHRKRDRRRGEVGDHVHAFGVVPAPRDVACEIGLVLVIGADQLDLLAEHAAAEILDRHLRRLNRPFAAEIGVDAGLIVEDADLDALRRRRRARDQGACHDGGGRQWECPEARSQSFLPLRSFGAQPRMRRCLGCALAFLPRRRSPDRIVWPWKSLLSNPASSGSKKKLASPFARLGASGAVLPDHAGIVRTLQAKSRAAALCSAISAARSSPIGCPSMTRHVARDHHPVGAMGAAENQRRERIVRAREARLVEREQREVRLMPSAIRPMSRTPEAARRAFRRPAQRVEMRHRVGAVAQPPDHQRVADASIMFEESLEAEPSTPRPSGDAGSLELAGRADARRRAPCSRPRNGRRRLRLAEPRDLARR